MKLTQFKNPQGNPVRNQFIIESYDRRYFQSYNSLIVCRFRTGKVILDKNTWNYSKTTSKYRNQFLGETTKVTERKIKSGEYLLEDLN